MRSPPMQDEALIDALNNASSLELYQLDWPRSSSG